MSTLPRVALIVVDVQNDFCEGGSLPVSGGAETAARIAAFLRERGTRYAAVVATRDYHDPASDNDGHFAAAGTTPDHRTTWPVHCTQGAPGAEYHPEFAAALRAATGVVHAVKGDGVASYSGFDAATDDRRTLHDVLSGAAVEEVHVAGLATDFCVRATALDATRHGYRTTVLLDLCAGVSPDTTVAAVTELLAAGVIVVASPTDEAETSAP